MPKLYECGLPGFNPGNPESKAIETMRIRPANDHAIITGRNGVGKTSAYIEPALDLLSRDTRGRKGRGSIAQRMRECHASHPYIYYEELIITNNAADKESTAVF